jgi:hypothetical protein
VPAGVGATVHKGKNQACFPMVRRVSTVSSRWVALWRSRGMIALLVNRDLRVRYSTSVLGYLWTILDPLLSALVYWFVFTVILKNTLLSFFSAQLRRKERFFLESASWQEQLDLVLPQHQPLVLLVHLPQEHY